MELLSVRQSHTARDAARPPTTDFKPITDNQKPITEKQAPI
jgi:hypothetical protein